jgi:hypothetical protein
MNQLARHAIILRRIDSPDARGSTINRNGCFSIVADAGNSEDKVELSENHGKKRSTRRVGLGVARGEPIRLDVGRWDRVLETKSMLGS